MNNRFTAAVVTNFYKLGGLKQQKLIYLQFWGPKFHHQFHWAEIKPFGRAKLSMEILQKNPVPCFL